MIRREVDNYIAERYERWLDYSKYYCHLTGMEEEAGDVLNEVLYMLLKKDEEKLEQLFRNKRNNGHRDMDYYILQMIKLNITSDSSPYKYKYRSIPTQENTDWQGVELVDKIINVSDQEDQKLRQIQLVKNTLYKLQIPSKTKKIFQFYFFERKPFSEWPGKETPKELETTCKKVLRMIRKELKKKRSTSKK